MSKVKAYNFQGRLHNNKKTSYERRTGKCDERLTLGDQQLGECKAYVLPGQGERTSNGDKASNDRRSETWGASIDRH